MCLSLNIIHDATRKWMYRFARPVDLARFQFHFENGSREAVLNALEVYQNEDGGFGHALELDSWNPHSTPIQTWTAMEILREIRLEDKDHPMVQGILKYLASGTDFNGKCWANTVLSNNDYPHAPWWSASEQSQEDIWYNPTAYMAGFILVYADPESELYQFGLRLAQESITYFLEQTEPVEVHVVSCYVALLEFCKEAGLAHELDLALLEDQLHQEIAGSITKDVSEWESGYVCKPSRFIGSPNSAFYPAIKELAHYEAELILKQIDRDGVCGVSWNWQGYEETWHIAKHLWQGDITIKSLLYAKAFQ